MFRSHPAHFVSIVLLGALLITACGTGGMQAGTFDSDPGQTPPDQAPLIQGKVLVDEGACPQPPRLGTAYCTLDDGRTRYDLDGEAYPCGPGWIDEDSDGLNDCFRDADGDGVNDLDGHHYDDGFMPHDEGETWHGSGGPMGDGMR